VAAVYWLAITTRRLLYQSGFFKVKSVEATVIVVGNVVAGGAGKTPTVIAIARHLCARGVKVGVVSRGYGRSGSEVRGAGPASAPADVGDEPLLIFKATGCPVFVGPSRHEAASALLAAHPDVKVILCDDGLQHYGLHRNLEVVVFDERGIGNGWLLPAGLLRESLPRHMVSKSGQASSRSITLHTGKRAAFAGYVATRTLAPFAVTQDGSRVALDSLTTSRQKPLFAVAGLAQPGAFFDMLYELHLPLTGVLGLPDHYDFNNFDASLCQRYTLLCTEKDAAKLWRIAPDALAIPLIQTMEEDFWHSLDAAISLPSNTPLSSAHGHKTA
jgi:tetraacyldisaccharide 4'-kinase